LACWSILDNVVSRKFGLPSWQVIRRIPALEKELANYFYSVYSVLQINTLEAMYE
jgi:hypothetical protein